MNGPTDVGGLLEATRGARAFIGKLEKGNQAECLMLLKKLTELLHTLNLRSKG